uniref:Spatacsin C-terminal domain-containing protein n=1 Tax=Mola mola TaxID=94237 RepID=A0A3Q3XKL6_MOLML
RMETSEAAQRPESTSTEVCVIPENPHCVDVAEVQKAELAPGGSLLGCLGVGGRLVVWDPADREASPAAVDGLPRPPSSPSRAAMEIRRCSRPTEERRYSCIHVISLIDFWFSAVCELQSARVLSFAAGRCCVLLNCDWLLQLQWQQTEAELQTVSCCNIQLTDRNRHAAMHHCVCRETLFILCSTGLISVFNIWDGVLLATVDLPAYLSSRPADDDLILTSSSGSSCSFCLLQVSADLSTAVAVTQSHAAVAVDLDHYFRYGVPEREKHKYREIHNQDSLQSSGCSVAALGSGFSPDRSWEARLNSLYSRAQQTPSSSSHAARPSWSSSLHQLASHQAQSSAHSRAPPGGATVAFSVPESSAASQLSVSEFSAQLTFISPGNKRTTAALWDLESGSLSYHRAEGEAAPVQRCGEKQHRLLLKKTGVFQVLFSVSQQDLLSRLMLFGSAATVDAVCHLNSWGRCSIPVHALHAGLKNRQLDMVDFYLKSKENLLKPAAESARSLTHRVQELRPALDLLCSAVRDSHSEAQSRQFSEQLLSITMCFVSAQVRSVLINAPDEDADVRSCVDVLDRYVAELRRYMQRFPWPAGGDASGADSADPVPEEAQEDEWAQLPTEEVVRQSVLTNQIPRAQAVLRRRSRPERRLSALRMEGLRQVFSCLQRRDLRTAVTLLTNMGFSVKKQLHSICLYTDDKDLREFVFPLSTNLSLLVCRLVQMVCRMPGGGEELLEELVGQKRSKKEGALWRNLRLDWVRNWDPSCRTAIQLSRLQHTELTSCDSAVLWHYLTSLHDQRRAVSWIDGNGEASGDPRWPELIPELVSGFTVCSTYMKENILDLLARYKLHFHPKLLEILNTVPLRELSCIAELLIVAHDCFSLTCNMEGIVRVLQAARFLSHTFLFPGEHFSLLVRLLTGIGRYNEMTYVFDLLHQSHRFEMLLRKKVDSSNLKTALLDYLKRCLPADSEKHNMVALCFSMRREIGENHEIAARTQLKMIESQAWVITPELKSSLVKVLGLLKDAAESFSKDSCVRQASRCVRMAKLVALQLHFLNQESDLRVINLRPAELLDAVVSLPRCYQVFVLSEAYSYSPDWAEILYQKVVLNGDFVYLEELRRHRPLTSGLFEDIFTKLQGAPSSATANVKRLLTHCDDVYTRYRLAYQQRLYDVTKTLLEDAKTASYLNDRLTGNGRTS